MIVNGCPNDSLPSTITQYLWEQTPNIASGLEETGPEDPFYESYTTSQTCEQDEVSSELQGLQRSFIAIASQMWYLFFVSFQLPDSRPALIELQNQVSCLIAGYLCLYLGFLLYTRDRVSIVQIYEYRYRQLLV